MQRISSAKQAPFTESASAALVLREAKRLHRAATSDSISTSLPVLRRLLGTEVLRGVALPEAFRRRATLQRKHFLRLLAAEAGFESWERYRPALCHVAASELEHFKVLQKGPAFAKHWFANEREARDHEAKFGGRTVRMGCQAVVLTPALVEAWQ
ncbi:hypothetical protein QTI66_04300 [Variovorax sp. J22R133]|uniref:hypothetical protein n=1 Tax=Variovorax brevis TaxID=3053503 RepID=UPI002577A3BD|nr:hypothetical protein [Variovorax sp. J22R133]MDM0111356.1 hypothetical protein [Variovorax sp. J22R133]